MLNAFLKLVLCLLVFVTSNVYAYDYDVRQSLLSEKNIQVESEKFRYDGMPNFRIRGTTFLDEGLQKKAQSGSFFVFEASLVATKGLVDPKTIRFTQDSIGATFKDGRSVQGLIDALKSGKVSPNDLPPIRTFVKDGLTFSLDNRRLFAASQAGVKIRTVPATAQEIARELPRKFTTPNQGCIICIRGGTK